MSKRMVSDSEIIAAYKNVGSYNKVAEKFGLGEATVQRVLKKNGIERTGLQEYRATMGRPKTEPYIGIYAGSTEEIIEMYQGGMSMRDIAARIGRSTHVVLRRIKAAGISRPYQGSGPDHSGWKGERIEAGQGYWKVWIPPDDPMAIMRTHQGYVKEHRLVMARKLGRPLLDTETVHHRDDNRSNNDISNLQLRHGNHGKHVVLRCRSCGSYDIEHASLDC
jgi:transposase